jgi:hypothetical protein
VVTTTQAVRLDIAPMAAGQGARHEVDDNRRALNLGRRLRDLQWRCCDTTRESDDEGTDVPRTVG